MPDILDGQMAEVQGSAKKPYILKNVGGVYSCSCPAWRNQSLPIESRTCKHIRKYRGEEAESMRLGGDIPKPAKKQSEEKEKPPFLLANDWENDTDLEGWWMSEKLDGVRAYWDGKRFISRRGNIFHTPDYFVEGLPDHTLDGELWIGRKQFQKTSGFVRRHDKHDGWRLVKFLMFDIPCHGGLFEARLQQLYAMGRLPFAEVHDHFLCEGKQHLLDALDKVEKLGGEGMMLRKPGSLYESGRSSTLLKVKTFYDSEAVVTSYVAGRGKHKGRMGALWAVWPNGKEFKIGTGFSDAERKNPPPVGSTITFRYQELTDDGKPRFASFIRMYEPI